jgi:hypothetical protein
MRQLNEKELASKLWRIPATGEPEPVGDEWPQLAELQRGVGGYVEHVLCRFHGEEAHLFVNEDGHRLALPRNEFATLLYAAHQDVPVEDVVRALRGKKPSVVAMHVIVGDVLLWFGPLPASETE